MWRAAWVMVAALSVLLAACGDGEQVAPMLEAPPTRTPVPVEQGEAGSVASQVEIISLLDPIEAFLTAAEEASALDRIDLFSDMVIQAAPVCFESMLYPDALPLELVADLRLTSMNPAIWQASVDTFPGAVLEARIRAVIDEAEALLPTDGPLHLCMVPLPPWRSPEELPRGGVSSTVLGTTVWLTCAEGDACLDFVEVETAAAYGWAYQAQQIGTLGSEFSLQDMIILFGRADAFAREIYPDETLAWTDALDPAQEAELWSRMQEDLEIPYRDGGIRDIDEYLYGTQSQSRYPAWGGVYIGAQIVEAYRESHPDMTLAALMMRDPAEIVAESGYSPAE